NRTVVAGLCVAAGTLVETEKGSQPIEDIRAGGWVWTRNGLRSVRQAGMTNLAATVYEVEFSNGRILQATAEHPVFIRQKGFVPVHLLEAGDEALAWHKQDYPLTACGLLSGAGNAGISTKKTGITATAAASCYTAKSIWQSIILFCRQGSWSISI